MRASAYSLGTANKDYCQRIKKEALIFTCSQDAENYVEITGLIFNAILTDNEIIISDLIK